MVISFNKNEIQGFGSTVTGRLNKTQDFVVIDKDRDTFQFNLGKLKIGAQLEYNTVNHFEIIICHRKKYL